jgi:hypothetical protein
MSVATKLGVYAARKIIGRKTISTATRLFGRKISVVGWGISAYEAAKTFRTFSKNNPYNVQIRPLREEQEKWGGAISCIGIKPYKVGDISSIVEGGAINELGKKTLFRNPCPDYGGLAADGGPNAQHNQPFTNDSGEETSVGNDPGEVVLPNPASAKELIHKAIDYVQSLENPLAISEFEAEHQKGLAARLIVVDTNLEEEYVSGADYTQQQSELSSISSYMKEVKGLYDMKIGELEKERDGHRLKHVAVAGAAAAGAFVFGKINPKKV